MTREMQAMTSNDVALGVADRAKAIEFYTGILGFKLAKETAEWAELESGALKLYIVEDEVHEPCFELLVEDVDSAKAAMEAAGCKQVDLAPGEVFMRDPFGYLFCVSRRR